MNASAGPGLTLAHPVLLVVGLLVTAALVLGALRLTRSRSAALAAAGVAAPGGRGLPLGRWLTLGGVLLLALAWAGPAAALPVGRSAGTVILAMDVSGSMGATDVAPSRLAAAQRAATAFIDAQPENVDIGVVGFDQGALTTSLPTADRDVSRAAVASLRLSGGTSLASAILGSLSAVTGKTVTLGRDGSRPDIGRWTSATIVLFSDGGGGQAAGGADDADAAAALAQDAGVHLETVGVGTAAGADVKVDGYALHTALDADRLTALAQTTGGAYHPASDAAELDGVASGIDLRLTVSRQDVPLAGGVVAAALALLVAGAALTTLRTGRLV
ncbi:VWA domain-containing protein [Microlunatus flavus]|uniref:Ca-activated chloride channel family protein n=1 Tax=Microlunatus flavus TaxID=1036181 RepID=A0A1H9M282_9ACTN|nr:VWA domain-containing protein [Microlunatus flavus]SER17649.1 Ca-activated chloride channel family protein [Microlunatus flavus]